MDEEPRDLAGAGIPRDEPAHALGVLGDEVCGMGAARVGGADALLPEKVGPCRHARLDQRVGDRRSVLPGHAAQGRGRWIAGRGYLLTVKGARIPAW